MHGRLLLPALFGLLMPLAAVPVALPRRASVRTIVTWAGLGCIGVWVVVCAFFLRWSFEGTIIRDGIPEGIVNEREFFVLRTGSSHPMTVDDYLGTSFDWVEHGYEMRLLAGTNPRIVLTDYGIHPLGPQVDPRITLVAYARSIGVQSHAAGDAVHLVDLLGLGDPLASRMASQEEERPGHAKGLPQVWIHARYADLTHVRFLPDALQAATASLQCGDAATLVKAVNAPLTWRLFATNIRDSWRLSTLSIDPDPFDAYEELCRNGR